MTTQLSKFSVIIPNFNNASTLGRAINSVLAQTVQPHEIIVVDDGSIDNSAQVAKSFDTRIRYFYQENRGVSAARNVGVELATGDWLAFLDADDEYLPTRLEAHASWIAAQPTIDFLLGDQEARTPDGELIHTFMAKSQAGRQLFQLHGQAARMPISIPDFELLIADGFSEIRTLSLPRSKFLELGGFSLEHKIGEDLHFFIRLFSASENGGVVPQILSTYYIYPSSTLRKNPLTTMELFVIAIESLESEMSNAYPAVRKGFSEKCRQNRLSLAYAYLRVNRKKSAVASVIPTFARNPSLKNFKDILSVCRGLPRSSQMPVPQIERDSVVVTR